MDNISAIIQIMKDSESVEDYLVQATDVAHVLINGIGMPEENVQERIKSRGRFEFGRHVIKSLLMELYKWHQKKKPKTEGEIKVIMALDAVNCIKDSYVRIKFI